MPRKHQHTRLNDTGQTVFAKVTPEEILVQELEANQAKAEKKIKKAKEKAIPPPPPTEKDLEAYSSDGDLLDIWQRRMINPDQRATTQIRVKTPGLHLRWINLANNGRYQRARYEEGWMPVRQVELVDEREIYGASFTTEGYVCRGEKQSEMLMKIPEAVWKQIRSRRYALVEKSNRQIKEHMQSAGAAHFSDKYNNAKGHEMADTVSRFKGEVKFGTEQVEPDADILENDLTVVE